MNLSLRILPDQFAVCRLAPASQLPSWASQGPLWSLTRTPAELSVVCREGDIPRDVELQVERGWRCLRVTGPLDFALTGVLASLATPLAAAGVSIFVLSTYDTDYVLVRSSRLVEAVDALSAAGHQVSMEEGNDGKTIPGIGAG